MLDIGSRFNLLLQLLAQLTLEAPLDLLNTPEKMQPDNAAESLLVFFLLTFHLPSSLSETGEAVARSLSLQTDTGHRLSVWVATVELVGEVAEARSSTPLTIEGVGESNSTTPAKPSNSMAACSKPVC